MPRARRRETSPPSELRGESCRGRGWSAGRPVVGRAGRADRLCDSPDRATLDHLLTEGPYAQRSVIAETPVYEWKAVLGTLAETLATTQSARGEVSRRATARGVSHPYSDPALNSDRPDLTAADVYGIAPSICPSGHIGRTSSKSMGFVREPILPDTLESAVCSADTSSGGELSVDPSTAGTEAGHNVDEPPHPARSAARRDCHPGPSGGGRFRTPRSTGTGQHDLRAGGSGAVARGRSRWACGSLHGRE